MERDQFKCILLRSFVPGMIEMAARPLVCCATHLDAFRDAPGHINASRSIRCIRIRRDTSECSVGACGCIAIHPNAPWARADASRSGDSYPVLYLSRRAILRSSAPPPPHLLSCRLRRFAHLPATLIPIQRSVLIVKNHTKNAATTNMSRHVRGNICKLWRISAFKSNLRLHKHRVGHL